MGYGLKSHTIDGLIKENLGIQTKNNAANP